MKKAAEDKKTNTTDWSKLITKPGFFEHKSQEEDIKAFREWSVDEAYMKDLKEIHGKPNVNFDVDLATGEEKTRCIKLYGLLASLMRGRALQLDLMPGGV